MSRASGNPSRLIMAALLLAGLGLRLVFMQTSLGGLPVTSDEAMIVLQAKQIVRDERPLLFMAQPFLFPLGSYLMAPLVEMLPRTPLGARLPGLGLGLVCFLGTWLLITRLGPRSLVWPGLLLAAFPSAYLLLHQAAYPVPQYEYSMALWLLASWLAWLMLDKRPPAATLGLAGLLGLVCGLGVSVHPLGMSLLAPLALTACLSGGWRQAPARGSALFLGLILGLMPFLAALWLFPEAAGHATSGRSLSQALHLITLPVFEHAMAGALGALVCAFPDFGTVSPPAQWPSPTLATLFMLLLLAAGLTVLSGLRRRQYVEPSPRHWFMAAYALAPWLGLLLFMFNDRANSGQFRYLLVLPWCLPFLAVQTYSALRGRARRLVGGLAVLLAAFNLVTAASLLAIWREPGFAGRHALVQDLAPVLELLGREGISHCFASHWTAYRVTFATDEKIICAQPLNQRFLGWPIPYRDEVLRARRVAYVLTSPDAFSADDFESDLKAQHITSNKAVAGPYNVYFDFQRKERGSRVAPGRISARASLRQDLAALLNDGDASTRWTTGRPQEPGMWLEIWLEQPALLNRLVMLYHKQPDDFPQGLRLLVRQGKRWRVLEEEIAAAPGNLVFHDQRPVYEKSTQEINFPATLTDGLRLEITKPNSDPNRFWSITEVELFLLSGTEGQ